MGQLWTGIQMGGLPLILSIRGWPPAITLLCHPLLSDPTPASNQPRGGRASRSTIRLLSGPSEGGGSCPLSCQWLELSRMNVPDLPATGKDSPAVSSWTKEGWVFVGSWQSLSVSFVSPGATVKHLQFPIKCVPLLIPLSPSLQNLWIRQRDLQDVLIKCLTFPWLRNSLSVYPGV